MTIVHPTERLLCGVVSGVGSLSRRHLTTMLGTARHSGPVVEATSAAAALATVARAYKTVPAYRAHVDAHGGLRKRRRGESPEAYLATLPTTSKRTYIDTSSVAARCTGGRIPADEVEIDESAGSTGMPYQWVRSTDELTEVRATLALMARWLLGDPSRPVVTLNAFSMGAWATGTNVSAALASLGLVKSCGPDTAKVLAAMRLLGPDPVYVITGYPPFLDQLLAAAAAEGFDLTGFELHGFVGGEGMGEGLRTRLERSFRRVWSAYGASDLDIGVAGETPLSVWLRQCARRDPLLAQALFGTTQRLPMVFQYDPSSYFIETVDGAHGPELAVTVTRPTLSPRLRYCVGDAGGVLSLDEALRIAALHGHRPGDPSGRMTRAGESWGAPLDLPLLFLHGRADSTVSFMGANLYPEDVQTGIDALDPALGARAFCLELVGDEDPVPCVHLEVLHPGGGDEAAVAEAVRGALRSASADYRAALQEDPRSARLLVQLWAYDDGPFAINTTRIKRRYVLS